MRHIDFTPPPAWHQDAACAQLGVGMADEFFTDKGGSNELARRICANCPVNTLCDEQAMAGDEYGVWAGRSRHERMQAQGRWAS